MSIQGHSLQPNLPHVYAQTNVQLFEQMLAAGFSTEDVELTSKAHELAVRLLHGLFRPEGEHFVTHLVGTASILVRYEARLPIVLAGLLHAVYDFGEFGGLRRGFTPRRRKLVRDVVGDETEGIVHRYTCYPWTMPVVESLPGRITELSQEERELVLMRLANELEEGADVSLLYCPPEARQHRAHHLGLSIPVAEAMGLTAMAAELRAGQERALASNGEASRPELGRRFVYEQEPFSRLQLAVSFAMRSGVKALTPQGLRKQLRSWIRH